MGRGRRWKPQDPDAPSPRRPVVRDDRGLQGLGFRLDRGVARARIGPVRLEVRLGERWAFRAQIPGIARRVRIGPEGAWAGLRLLAGRGDFQVGLPALDRAARFDGDPAAAFALAGLTADALLEWIPRGLVLQEGVLTASLDPSSGAPRDLWALKQLAGQLHVDDDGLPEVLARQAREWPDPTRALEAVRHLDALDAATRHPATLLASRWPAVREAAVRRLGPSSEVGAVLRDVEQGDAVRLAAIEVLDAAGAWAPLLAAPVYGAPRWRWERAALRLVGAQPARLSACGEDVLLTLLELAGGDLRLAVVGQLGQRGGRRAVAPLVALATGVLVLPSVKRAARAALDLVVGRVGVEGGELTLIDGPGSLADAE